MFNRFKVGDYVDYQLHKNMEIIADDGECFILKDSEGYKRKIYKSFVADYGKFSNTMYSNQKVTE